MSGEIQAAVYQALTNFFDQALIIKEWSVRKSAADTFGDSASYAPRLDIAVGPFNLTFRDRVNDADAIRNFRHPLIQWLEEEVLTQNHGGFFVNRNPRCLLGRVLINAQIAATFGCPKNDTLRVIDEGNL